MNVTVQVPAYSEGDIIEDTLAELTAQREPTWADVSYEAWVTPSCPNPESCRTWVRARDFDGVDAHLAPNGKLSTRNEAHGHAVEGGADVLVTWDADAPPLHDDVLAELLAPLRSDGVVATNSAPTAPPTVVGVAVNVLGRVEDVARPHMHGQCSAFTAEAWQQAGPFDTDLDETEVFEVRQEEEFGFYRRLAELGAIEHPDGAMVENHPRRAECLLGVRNDGYCRRRGVETFQGGE